MNSPVMSIECKVITTVRSNCRRLFTGKLLSHVKRTIGKVVWKFEGHGERGPAGLDEERETG